MSLPSNPLTRSIYDSDGIAARRILSLFLGRIYCYLEKLDFFDKTGITLPILMPTTFTSEFDCVDAIIARAGKQLRVATPLAAGKPVPILNALYKRAKEDPEIALEIYTSRSH